MFQNILLAVLLCASVLDAGTAALIKVPNYRERQNIHDTATWKQNDDKYLVDIQNGVTAPVSNTQKKAAIYMIEKLDITGFSDSNKNIFRLTKFNKEQDYNFKKEKWEDSARIDNQGITSDKRYGRVAVQFDKSTVAQVNGALGRAFTAAQIQQALKDSLNTIKVVVLD